MKTGDWVRLGQTLSFNEGTFKVVDLTAESVMIRGDDGGRYTLSRGLLETLRLSPAAPRRRFATRTNFFRQELGVLAAAGYHVGRGGLDRERRRAILSWVFEAPVTALPKVGDPAYLAEWGAPSSAQRFSKIANCLFAFAQNGLARPDQPREAIEDWEEDLQWFYDSYGKRVAS